MTERGTTVINPTDLSVQEGSSYPEPYKADCRGKRKVSLGDTGGLTQYGVNLVTLPPGGWSSQRHWHSHEDEFVWVVSGELVLVSEVGEMALSAGMAAAFRAGIADGHHLVNRSDTDATYLEVGSRREEDDVCHYPDIDLHLVPDGTGRQRFVHKSGEPY